MVGIKTAIVSRFLLEAERTIATIERCQPLNYAEELERVKTEWSRGVAKSPCFVHAPAPELRELRTGLAALTALEHSGAWGAMLAARAAELDSEAELVEAIGTSRFRALARARYRRGDEVAASGALDLAHSWATLSLREAAASRHCSDDGSDPKSLLSELRRLLTEHGVPFRVEARANMAAAAATGDGAILLAADRWWSYLEARRIAAHEVLGHAVPRACAAHDPSGLLAAGTAGASDDEEGCALLVEQRAQVMDDGRRQTLGFRHLAAEASFDAADYCEVVQLLLGLGGTCDQAHGIAARVFRGGGLGREWIYLPAMLRVEAKLAADPSAESWFQRGRVSAAGIELLARLGEPPAILEIEI